MLGYRLVPVDVYALMLDALRTQASAAPLLAGTIAPMPSSEPADRAAPFHELSHAVRDACAQYAFGDASERVLNLAKARQLAADGVGERDIVAVIKAGGLPVYAG